ncbi:SDR family NAD(P)-dependent oxidoreductase [Flavobacterium sp. WC2416]|uniref:SDR family NAD(P)-dependent oxidoreductase n=1 Tax=Flavobacterium sp. WC2416 TaxID=3234141 RepID=A0AB39W929_9FLAO
MSTSEVLKGKVALVTGGNSGIGFGAAKSLAEAGAFVYITGRKKQQLDSALEKLGVNARAIQADVTSKSQMDEVAAIIKSEKGSLDIVFANAGGGSPIPLQDVTEDYFDKTFNVNVKGVVFTMQSVLPILNDGSSVILNASITAYMGLPGFGMYAASKAAVRSFARSWTTDLKDRRIRVNALSPGVVPTEGYRTEQGMTEEQVNDYVAAATKEIPVGRVGSPEDMGNAVVFLASEASSFISGIELTVDGGQTMVYAGKS